MRYYGTWGSHIQNRYKRLSTLGPLLLIFDVLRVKDRHIRHDLTYLWLFYIVLKSCLELHVGSAYFELTFLNLSLLHRHNSGRRGIYLC